MKKTFYSEAAYILGLITLALGTVLMEAANFGVSMVVAPAYLLYLKLSPSFPFFTFGMAEYLLQFILLLLLIVVVRRFRPPYLLSFVTALLYGAILDAFMAAFALIPVNGILVRILFYIAGLVTCSCGVSLLFQTYIAPEVYELFVKEVAARYKLDIPKTKTVYDCVSCLIAVALSFLFFGFGRFEGVKLGTILCALVNGSVIGCFSRFWAAHWTFKDGLPLRKFFS